MIHLINDLIHFINRIIFRRTLHCNSIKIITFYYSITKQWIVYIFMEIKTTFITILHQIDSLKSINTQYFG